MRESEYQAKLIKKLYRLYPDCVILKNDSSYLAGVPDLVIFHRDRYAFLEVKAASNSPTQPLQPHWVKTFDEMSFGAFIHPSNEQEVLDALEKHWVEGTR